MTTGVFILGLLVVVVIAVAVREERAIRREARRARRRAHAQRFRQAMDVSMEPDPVVRAWTQEEREMLGLNDTIALISRLDKELGAEYAQVKLTPPQHVRITNQEA